jgi:hypothetical protein
MALSFYFDQHVPAAIARGLRLRNIDVLTAYEDRADSRPDEQIFLRATKLNRVMFSQDEDFLALAHRFQAEGLSYSGLAYAHQMRISIGRCIADLELIAKAFSPHDMANHIEFLPL